MNCLKGVMQVGKAKDSRINKKGGGGLLAQDALDPGKGQIHRGAIHLLKAGLFLSARRRAE